jgi:hypothetical protein
MKLPKEVKNPNLWLNEFDQWITPSLEEIQNSEKFRVTLKYIEQVFDRLADLTDDYVDYSKTFDELVGAYLDRVRRLDISERSKALDSLIITLLLSTAKTDNNVKCQFPLYLRDSLKWNSYPTIRRRKSEKTIVESVIPRTLKLESIVKRVVELDDFPTQQKALVTAYTKFLVRGERDLQALFQIGKAYTQAKKQGAAYPSAILEPLVTFQVRGSVSASGGHVPEQLLRSMMKQWGLVQDEDYNANDIVVKDDGDITEEVPKYATDDELLVETDSDVAGKEKTRAFDFVLPHKVANWRRRLFIQSQFYAGDSGSVSHKNVDQVFASRAKTKELVSDPLFIEYVDGAGYYSSLNGDLRKLLFKEDTHSFFQVRSAAIRLRQLLQSIGFLCPLEVEHAVAQNDGTSDTVKRKLLDDGYTADEVERVINKAVRLGFIKVVEGKYQINEERKTVVRQYAILDTIARKGSPLNDINAATYLLAPGYGPFYGIRLTILVEVLCQDVPYFAEHFQQSNLLNEDLEALKVKGWIKFV